MAPLLSLTGRVTCHGLPTLDVPRDGVLHWESCEFNHHDVLLPHKESYADSPPLKGCLATWLLCGSCVLGVDQLVPVPAPHSPGLGPSTPHHS